MVMGLAPLPKDPLIESREPLRVSGPVKPDIADGMEKQPVLLPGPLSVNAPAPVRVLDMGNEVPETLYCQIASVPLAKVSGPAPKEAGVATLPNCSVPALTVVVPL